MKKTPPPQLLLLDNETKELTYWERWLKLSNWNIKFFFASSIDQAIDYTINYNIDIYLIDLFLDGESGFDFLEYVKNKPGLKIVLTSSSEQKDVKKACELGAFLVNKQTEDTSNLQIIQMIKSLWELGKVPSEEYLLNRSGVESEMLVGENFKNHVGITNNRLQEIEDKITELEVYILGNYDKEGLKQQINKLQILIDKHNFFYNLCTDIISFGKRNPVAGTVIFFLASIFLITLPLVIISKLLG